MIPMIINVLRFPISYWLYREGMIYNQAGVSHNLSILVHWENVLQITA